MRFEKMFNKHLLFSILSGILFTLVFQWGYHNIPQDYYQDRDDGIITLSHAKNLADYGTISINPSGERVEGYSAPVQFFVYYILYKITGLPYYIYSKIQTVLTSFLLGFIIIRFFESNYLLGILLSLFSSLLLIEDPSFLGWHGSGMENAITHLLFLLTIYLLYVMLKDKRVNYFYSIFVFLASISRIESIYHIAPLLIVFSILWFIENRNIKVLYFLLITSSLWCLFNAFRYFYFGDFLPNTAYGQGISLTERISSLLKFEPEIYRESILLSKEIIKMHHGYLLLLSMPLILFGKRLKEHLCLYVLLFSLFVTACLNPFILGETFIDSTRTTTQSAIVSVIFVSILLFQLRDTKLRYWVLLLFILLSFMFIKSTSTEPYYLGWSTKSFLKVRSEFLKLQEENRLFRPTVSNPDLGVISWYKDFNIVDLGKLGNPLLARFEMNSEIADYFFDFAAPDFVELHQAWSCHYHYLLEDDRFMRLYEPVEESKDEWLKKNCHPQKKAKTGMWVRKDIRPQSSSRERVLIDSLKDGISLSIVEKELDHCSGGEALNSCTYVTRTAYRFLPEFVNSGLYDELVDVFENKKSNPFDIALLTGRIKRDWYKKAVMFIKEYNLGKKKKKISEVDIFHSKYLTLSSLFMIYKKDGYLGLLKKNCTQNDVLNPFMIMIWPVNIDDLPELRKSAKTQVKYFYFNDHGFIEEGICKAVVKIPEYPVLAIGIAQFYKKEVLWKATIQ